MKDKAFSISLKKPAVRITGGMLWKAPDQDSPVTLQNKVLCIAVRPGDTVSTLIKLLQKRIWEESPVLYLRLIANYLLSPVFLILPTVILIAFLGILGAYGNQLNDLLNSGNEGSTIGIDRATMVIIETLLFIVIASAFPLFFSGDLSNTYRFFKRFLDTHELNKRRVEKAMHYLAFRGKYVEKVELWNPGFLTPGQDWVGEALVPGIIASGIPFEIHARVDEKFAAKRLIENCTDERNAPWAETPLSGDSGNSGSIPVSYLEAWEKELLPVLVCASTANLPDEWYLQTERQGVAQDTVLHNVLSVPLMELVVRQFGNRLFSEIVSGAQVSVEMFAHRCANDYGLIQPVDALSQDLWFVDSGIVEKFRQEVRAEMGYALAWFQANVSKLLKLAVDPAAALILAGTHKDSSIYHEPKLLAIEGFIHAITRSEQYKLLREYWPLLSVQVTAEGAENVEEKMFRIIRTDALKALVLAFRRAGMYEKTGICYDFLRTIYPVDSGIGEGIVLGEQGKYEEAVTQLLKMEREWMGGALSDEGSPAETPGERPGIDAVSQLNLYISLTVIIVMNRLQPHLETARRAFEVMRRILNSMGDGERDNYQVARYYNVLASYYEWEGEFEKALETYDKGLKVPEVEEALISSLLVNVGIIYRMVGKKQTETAEAIRYLRQGVDLNGEGVYAKEVIGNEDQLPIALHNLAESCIELAMRLSGTEEKKVSFRQALRHSQLGLDINHRIGSVKKKGQLLAERYVAAWWLRQMDYSEGIHWESFHAELLEWVKKNSGNKGYDIEVVLELMQHTHDFTDPTLAGLESWLSARV
jgi:tetratricopeptide (TPR) repeat protein